MARLALLSVSDKRGLIEFAKSLVEEFGFDLISSGGTATALKEAGIPVTKVSDYTGFPEILGGRVKTLHPRIHGGILARREVAEDVTELETHEIRPIALVVVNLYPFEQTIAKPDVAAKNYHHVAIVTDPADYAVVLREMQSSQGAVGAETRFELAKKAFSHTAEYDGAISNYLTSLTTGQDKQRFPNKFNVQLSKVMDLRYGENPHQEAAFYRDAEVAPGALASFNQLQGKELSYNNIADADAAWECVKTFDTPACVIVKHANPCGVAIAPTLLECYQKAFSTDPTSAFGGIIAFNREIDANTAEAVVKQFVEVVIAPSISKQALEIFAAKVNVRVLTVALGNQANSLEYKRVGGGMLLQTPDALNVQPDQFKVVTKKQPTAAQMQDLLFAWRVAKYVKSNAIVFCGNGMTLGVGAGQMSRVDSTRIAAIKAQNAGLSLQGCAVASDAFFPFRDGVDVLAEAGASCVIQPGGSIRDEDVIAAADEHGLAMVLTGYRHFRH